MHVIGYSGFPYWYTDCVDRSFSCWHHVNVSFVPTFREPAASYFEVKNKPNGEKQFLIEGSCSSHLPFWISQTQFFPSSLFFCPDMDAASSLEHW